MSVRFDNSVTPRRVLLVSDDEDLCRRLAAALEVKGFRAESVPHFDTARNRIAVLSPEVVVVDAATNRGAWVESECQKVLRLAGELKIPVILLSTAGRFELTSQLIKAGASDFLTSPFSADELVRRIQLARLAGEYSPGQKRPEIERTANGSKERGKPRGGRERDVASLPEGLLIGRSAAFRRVVEQVRLVAPKETTVLVTGETGTGKERVARAIHAMGNRRDREMVFVNCGGIPANLLEDEFFGHVKGAFTDAYQARVGRFQQAHRSTIFLDEIGDLPLELQPKLLRALQERETHPIGGVETVRFDARVVAATNMDLWTNVQEGRFREDLFYRINVFPIHLPPLRERRDDIPLFVEHFVESFCRRDGLAPKRVSHAAVEDLITRSWRGNVRELENAVEIAVIRSQNRRVIEAFDFPEPRSTATRQVELPNADERASFRDIVSEFERSLINLVLERTEGNKSKAAEVLQLKRTTLVEKMKKFRNQKEQPVEK